MILGKYELENGNTLFHLGSRKDEAEHALLLAGGELLLLKTVHKLELFKEDIINDLKSMELSEFAENYGVHTDIDLLKEIKRGFTEGDYPAYLREE